MPGLLYIAYKQKFSEQVYDSILALGVGLSGYHGYKYYKRLCLSNFTGTTTEIWILLAEKVFWPRFCTLETTTFNVPLALLLHYHNSASTFNQGSINSYSRLTDC